jgi:putative DNA primase/helicase
LYEARRFFGEIALPKDDLEAVKLDTWLIAECKATGSNAVGKSRVLQRVTPASLRKADKLNKALEKLERANRIRQTKEGQTAMIEVNPALLEEVK